MPLTPATTDKFTKVGAPGSATTLAAPGYTTGVSTSIQVGSTTNWQTETKQIFAIDRAQIVNGEEVRIAGTYNEFEGIVTGANTISNIVRRHGTAQNYPAGSLTRVYIPVASTRENDLIDGLNQDHNGKGNHKSLTDDNNNEWIERGQVASAVNQVKITNAITGTNPKVEATGDDTNVGLVLAGKGTGKVMTDGLSPQMYANAQFDFIGSNEGVWTFTAGTLVGAMTAILNCFIAGLNATAAAVASKTFTASKDTYVDISSTGTLVYTEVANGAASPALAADSIRLGLIVSGASAITGVRIRGMDSLGNLIRPLPVGSKYTDSNGWTVYECGGFRKYVKKFGPSFGSVQSVGADSTSGALGEISGTALPEGVSSLSLMRNFQFTWSTSMNSPVFNVAAERNDLLSGSTMPTFYLRNVSSAAANVQNVYIYVELTTA